VNVSLQGEVGEGGGREEEGGGRKNGVWKWLAVCSQNYFS